ncbi:MAG: M48 family metallopeptidase [Deltaproteobacteria bacterium]|nr:M48 family metallopeptidase [Deltaproteobacteria bacterium]
MRLNWRIIHAPMSLVEYVVAHELVHLRHPEHTGAFWSALGRAIPDYERRREDLRRLGASFEWCWTSARTTRSATSTGRSSTSAP